MDSELVWVYMTAGHREEAKRIGRALLEERLAACVNIFDGMSAMYWWEGEIQEESETAMIAKTRGDLMESLIERVRELHSYDCPCIISLPIEDGYEGYLDWLAEETAAHEQA